MIVLSLHWRFDHVWDIPSLSAVGHQSRRRKFANCCGRDRFAVGRVRSAKIRTIANVGRAINYQNLFKKERMQRVLKYNSPSSDSIVAQLFIDVINQDMEAFAILQDAMEDQ